ncbi:MAG: SDR family oxidoreductase [Spirochaetes bacterium]|nr:SDR family oxidoreductase [Spirochaetota bacterium]
MLLQGRTALVTGAAKGIGKAIAIRYAEEGAAVVLADLLDTAELLETIAGSGGRALSFRVDITDVAAVEAMVTKAVSAFGTMDILVNNAGIIARGTILELTLETWKKVLDVNVNGAFNCVKAVIPHMVKNRFGRILTISSVAGKTGDITAAPVYGTSKGALNAFTKSLARQLAEFGITANAIAPHAIETDMSAEWSEERRRAVIGDIPLKRLGTAQEVAEAALFLVSEGASFITGEILNQNGGFFMD